MCKMFTTNFPTAVKIYVVIISKDWKLRSLSRAQLLEEGFEAIGLETLEEAVHFFRFNQIRADIILLDPAEQSIDARSVATMRTVSNNPPVILCARHDELTDGLRTIVRPHRVLMRPFSIGDLVQVVKEVALELKSKDQP